MEDKPDPDGISLILLNILYSEITVFAGLAVLFLSLLFLAGLFHALESEIKQKFKNKKGIDPPKNDKLRHLFNNQKRLIASLHTIQIFLRTGAAFAVTLIFRMFIKDPNALLIMVVAFLAYLVIILFGRYAVTIIPQNRDALNNPVIINTLFILHFVFYPLTSLKLLINKRTYSSLVKKGYLNNNTGTENRESSIFKGVENFNTITVKQVMRFRMDITAFEIDLDFHELLHNINKFGYSRIPIYRDTIDRIEGILYLKDVLPYIGRDKNFPWQNLLRPAYFVPEGKKIEELLKEFQEKHNHIALVVEGYGGISGLITLEDILEEIVGEINDELDEIDLAYVQLDDSTYIFEGKTSLTDFSRILEIDTAVFEEVKGDNESLGGLLLQINSNLPKKGDKIYFRNFVFRIDSANNKRVKKVRVHILEEKEVSNAD